MIIVAQSKKTIINFNEIQLVEINPPEAWKQGVYSIDTYINTENAQEFHIRLGKYNTEERAKEVLQEIVSKYKTTLYNLKTNETVVNVPKVYEMPTE